MSNNNELKFGHTNGNVGFGDGAMSLGLASGGRGTIFRDATEEDRKRFAEQWAKMGTPMTFVGAVGSLSDLQPKDLYAVGGTGVAHFRAPIHLTFSPQPDITTYELARGLPILFDRRNFYAENWETELGDLRRHFSRAI